MKRNFFVLAAVIIGSQLQAQQDSSAKVLEEAVTTANRFEQKQSQTGKVVSVITKDDLEKASGKTVAQLLNEQAGITINGAYNAAGSVQTVFMRGAAAGRTLVLVDGIPVNDPSNINNEFDINLISINDIERIEICRGAQSTLYGSDAIAGAINIITVKKDISKAFTIKASSGFGNKNTVRNNLQLFGKTGKLTYTTRFGKLSTNGFSSAYDSTNSGDFDQDGYDGNVLNAGLQYQFTSSLLIKTFIQHSQYRADIDAGGYADEKDYRIKNSRLASGAGLNFKKGIVNLNANYQYGKLERDYRNDSLYVRPSGTIFESNVYGGRTQFAELFGNITATEWLTVLAGFDFRQANMHQDYYSLSGFGPYSSQFKDTSMHQASFYGSLLIHNSDKRLNLETGGRLNKHSRYGTNSTFTLNPSYLFTEHWRLFGSVATGFKAPSIFQLYDAYSGNPELKAEKSTNYEVGVQQKHKHFSSRIVYFHRDIKNGIDYNNITYQYFNYVKQTVNGIELEVSAKPVTALSVSVNYSFMAGKEQTQSRKNFADTSYTYLLRRPKHNVNLSIGYQFSSSLFASIAAKYVSDRFDIGGYMSDDVLLKNYFLINAYAAFNLNPHVRFFADLQNITNNRFFDIRGYTTIPFLINGGISFEF